jgi:hypothetical protein
MVKKNTTRKKKCPAPGPYQCHPRVKPNGDTGCFPREVLETALPIRRKNQTQKGGSKTNLLQDVGNHLHIDPSNQRTLLNHLPIPEKEKQELAKKFLRPPLPEHWNKKPDDWLDSLNIRDVMKQYEEAYPNFKFLGPYPIDFAAPSDSSAMSKGSSKDCLVDEMCNLDLDGEELKGKDHIGMVFNLDPHYREGSHWIAAYINIPKKQCYYFDSYGMKPPKQIYKFMQWLSLQEPDIELGWNGRRFQYKDSECGIYCMYFLDRMIAGVPFLKFCRQNLSDGAMLQFRKWFYST